VSLAEYQQRLLTALSPDALEWDDPATSVVADAILEWAEIELASVCPIVTGLLSFDERLTGEVRIQLQRRDRPVSIQAWGMHFASRLSTDPDPWISWAAQVDAAMIAAAGSRRSIDPTGPADPMRAILLITSANERRSWSHARSAERSPAPVTWSHARSARHGAAPELEAERSPAPDTPLT
jgi:hypothetical protein